MRSSHRATALAETGRRPARTASYPPRNFGLGSSNGKVGVIGHCPGVRQAFLAAVSLPLDAALDCYGGAVVNPAWLSAELERAASPSNPSPAASRTRAAK